MAVSNLERYGKIVTPQDEIKPEGSNINTLKGEIDDLKSKIIMVEESISQLTTQLTSSQLAGSSDDISRGIEPIDFDEEGEHISFSDIEDSVDSSGEEIEVIEPAEVMDVDNLSDGAESISFEESFDEADIASSYTEEESSVDENSEEEPLPMPDFDPALEMLIKGDEDESHGEGFSEPLIAEEPISLAEESVAEESKGPTLDDVVDGLPEELQGFSPATGEDPIEEESDMLVGDIPMMSPTASVEQSPQKEPTNGAFTESINTHHEEPADTFQFENKSSGENEQIDGNMILLEKAKKVFKWVDTLLEKLPEEEIKTIIQSEGFRSYKEIFEELKIE